jgi:hypothetical protein
MSSNKIKESLIAMCIIAVFAGYFILWYLAQHGMIPGVT